MGSEHNRFLNQQPPAPPSKRWGGCWGGLSCFGTQKGGKRVVPASRQEANQPNGAQAAGLNNHTTGIHPSLLAPPSSPASFSNSALQSTAQSPNYFMPMSANSPGPSSTMFRTGPYAHETQLVSPPVFSNFTTEPSTAPYTPPPEIAHLTNPSSPDVPFAKLLSSSVGIKNREKANCISANDLQATYSLYPGSPASSLRSPISRASGDSLSSPYPDRDFVPQWDPLVPPERNHQRSESGRAYGLNTASASKLSQDSNFFHPATFAEFYLDQSLQSGGRISVSKESDVYTNGGNGHQCMHSKASKQDVEELEAYRASFGFSADEIVTTSQYVEISGVMEDSFTITPFSSNKPHGVETRATFPTDNRPETWGTHTNLPRLKTCKSNGCVNEKTLSNVATSCNDFEDPGSRRLHGDVSRKTLQDDNVLSGNEDIFSKMGTSRISGKSRIGFSSSDAEVDYRRGRSLREERGNYAWQY